MFSLNTLKNSVFYPLVLVSLAGYIFLSYFIERTDSVPLISTFTVLFAIYLLLISDLPNTDKVTDSEIDRKYNGVAIILRVVLLLAIPNLSDDFYRFIWDGRLLNAGINPFAQLPTFYINSPGQSVPGITEDLYNQLNSPEYFTIYPPVNQFIFWFSTLISGDNLSGAVVSMRIFLLAAEIGNIWLLPKVLDQFNLPKRYTLIYALNPLVIIEGVGNLHFEVMMVFFILLALWWLKKNQLILSATAIAFAVGTKLIPLILLPFLPRPLTLKRMLIYYAISGAIIIILFLPLLSPELIGGLESSLSLYYQKFEFNASIYYWLREKGFQKFGYNRIEFIGKDLVKWIFWSIIILAFWPFSKKPSLPTLFMMALGIYFLLSTTVHPWYIVTVLALSVFTGYKSPILWSYMIFLTYLGYSPTGFDLPNWVLFLEYGSVIGLFLFELSWRAGLIEWVKSKTL